MNEIIRKRKSIRKFDMTPLSADILDKVYVKITQLSPLYPDIHTNVDIENKTKWSVTGIKAPHYLLFYSEEKEGYLENTGFIGQQMDLFLSEIGLGSCWLGMAKPETASSELPFIIAMAFGKPDEPLHRDLAEFKRKPLSEISEGSDERLEAARLAPSGVNAQNWYFIAEDGNIHCYRKKPGFILGSIYTRLGCIDMGIALCHIAMESNAFRLESDSFNFAKKSDVPQRKGYEYMGTVGSDKNA